MTTLYEKQGRRYVPVSDMDACNGLPNGAWLVVVADGCTSVRRLVEPDHAGFEAAALRAEEAMLSALRKASETEPRDGPLCGKAKRAYEAWKAIMGEDVFWLTRRSAREIAQAGIQAVREAWSRRGETSHDL